MPWSFSRRATTRATPESTLLAFNRSGDKILVKDVCSGGLMVFGDPGASKTTGVLSSASKAAMSLGCSLIFTTVKPDDANRWGRLASLCNRAVRVVDLDTDTVNPLLWEQQRFVALGEGGVETITQRALLPLHQKAKQSGGTSDPFWIGAVEQLTRALVTIFVAAGEPLSFALLHDLLNELPRSPDEVQEPGFQRRSRVYLSIRDALSNPHPRIGKADIERAAAYVLVTLANYPEKTRESIYATASSAWSMLVYGPVGRMVNGDTNTWTPELLTDEPSVHVLDVPLQLHGSIGAITQRLILTMTQQAILRRNLVRADHPVFIVCDEYQEVLHPDDLAFARTARDRRGALIAATQTVGGIIEACGTSRDPRAAADAVLGMPAVKLFGSSSDPATCQFASSVFSQTKQPNLSFTQQDGSGRSAEQSGRSGGGKQSTFSSQFAHDVPPIEFQRLRRGGKENNYVCEFFVHCSGRIWKASGRPSLKVAFSQVLV